MYHTCESIIIVFFKGLYCTANDCGIPSALLTNQRHSHPRGLSEGRTAKKKFVWLGLEKDQRRQPLLPTRNNKIFYAVYFSSYIDLIAILSTFFKHIATLLTYFQRIWILLSALTHITRIRRDFDVANSPRYRTGSAPMLFQWSHSHMQHFSSRIPDKNRAIKRGLEQKNCTIKKSRYVCQGTNMFPYYWNFFNMLKFM